jgi:hypothetical protein
VRVVRHVGPFGSGDPPAVWRRSGKWPPDPRYGLPQTGSARATPQAIDIIIDAPCAGDEAALLRALIAEAGLDAAARARIVASGADLVRASAPRASRG